MDDTHIFGKSSREVAITKLIGATLEVSRINSSYLKNFPKARKDMFSLELALIEAAKEFGITEIEYRATVQKILVTQNVKKAELKAVTEPEVEA